MVSESWFAYSFDSEFSSVGNCRTPSRVEEFNHCRVHNEYTWPKSHAILHMLRGRWGRWGDPTVFPVVGTAPWSSCTTLHPGGHQGTVLLCDVDVLWDLQMPFSGTSLLAHLISLALLTFPILVILKVWRPDQQQHNLGTCQKGNFSDQSQMSWIKKSGGVCVWGGGLSNLCFNIALRGLGWTLQFENHSYKWYFESGHSLPLPFYLGLIYIKPIKSSSLTFQYSYESKFK